MRRQAGEGADRTPYEARQRQQPEDAPDAAPPQNDAQNEERKGQDAQGAVELIGSVSSGHELGKPGAKFHGIVSSPGAPEAALPCLIFLL